MLCVEIVCMIFAVDIMFPELTFSYNFKLFSRSLVTDSAAYSHSGSFLTHGNTPEFGHSSLFLGSFLSASKSLSQPRVVFSGLLIEIIDLDKKN